MATVTHYIYSHYEPKDRVVGNEHIRSDGRTAEEEAESDPWQTESAFGAQHRRTTAPGFVPAAITYDQINNMMGASQPEQPSKPAGVAKGGDIAEWYRSLAQSRITAPVPQPPTPKPPAEPVASGSRTTLESAPQFIVPTSPKRYKNLTWFAPHIRRPPAHTPPSTLADLLNREPPPSNGDKSFDPPVYIAIGPSNKGYTMLQKSGWSEGETLGPHVVRKADRLAAAQGREPDVLLEELELDYGDDGEITEIRTVEIVDLTGSDDEDYLNTEPPPSPAGKALLTPLPTILKLDRLGIGLKAKTVGPYRASKKRVTHNQAALAAHIRANEELRKMKKLMGRGTKAFARKAKAEEEQRRQLLASLNTP